MATHDQVWVAACRRFEAMTVAEADRLMAVEPILGAPAEPLRAVARRVVDRPACRIVCVVDRATPLGMAYRPEPSSRRPRPEAQQLGPRRVRAEHRGGTGRRAAQRRALDAVGWLLRWGRGKTRPGHPERGSRGRAPWRLVVVRSPLPRRSRVLALPGGHIPLKGRLPSVQVVDITKMVDVAVAEPF